MSAVRELSILLTILLGASPSAAFRCFSAIHSECLGAPASKPVMSRKGRSAQKTFGMPILGSRGVSIKKVASVPLPAPEASPSATSEATPPAPFPAPAATRIPQYLKIFLPSNPQNHRSPPVAAV